MRDSDWSDYMAAQHPESPEGRQALNRLCNAYWRPVYLYARSKGRSPQAAEDLTHNFFLCLLHENRVKRGPTSFRAYLLKALKLFLGRDQGPCGRVLRPR